MTEEAEYSFAILADANVFASLGVAGRRSGSSAAQMWAVDCGGRIAWETRASLSGHTPPAMRSAIAPWIAPRRQSPSEVVVVAVDDNGDHGSAVETQKWACWRATTHTDDMVDPSDSASKNAAQAWPVMGEVVFHRDKGASSWRGGEGVAASTGRTSHELSALVAAR